MSGNPAYQKQVDYWKTMSSEDADKYAAELRALQAEGKKVIRFYRFLLNQALLFKTADERADYEQILASEYGLNLTDDMILRGEHLSGQIRYTLELKPPLFQNAGGKWPYKAVAKSVFSEKTDAFFAKDQIADYKAEDVAAALKEHQNRQLSREIMLDARDFV